MSKHEAKKRIDKLKKVINHHRYLYHVLNKEEISIAALDSLKKELFDLEKEYPEFVTPDSPTQRVEGKPLDKFTKIEHKEKMFSLNDAFNEQEIEEWEQRIKKLLTPSQTKKLDYFCMVKADGLAASLSYNQGVFDKGATRGNGKVGEDVTNNLKTIEQVPLKLEKAVNVTVRGEVFISKKDFKEINKKQEKKGQELYANPRNTAAGALRQLDPKVARARKLSFAAWQLLGQENKVCEYQELKQLGFKTVEFKYCQSLVDVFNYFKEISKKRDKMSYQIDGLVVWINDNQTFQSLGVVGKAPRGAIAFKFPMAEATTIVEDIKVQIGRTGALTPVAILKPVQIGGATISRATLHNQDEIKRLGIKIGDTVVVGRAGDVIPKVFKVLKDLRTGREKAFSLPKKCPVCGGALAKEPSEAIWRCVSSKCKVRQRKAMHHFVSKPAFNIEGLGPKVVDQLVEQGLVADPADFFDLKQGDLEPLERFAQKSAINLIQAISQAKKISLARFIFALGIGGVGEETAIDLANYFRDITKLEQATEDDLLKLNDIGPIVARSIVSFFKEKKNQDIVQRLLKNVKLENPKQIKQGLKGKVFVLTGTLEDLTRDKAKEIIRSQGGDISSTVSKATSFVLAGANPGSKLQKAQTLGVKVLTEQGFLKMIN